MEHCGTTRKGPFFTRNPTKFARKLSNLGTFSDSKTLQKLVEYLLTAVDNIGEIFLCDFSMTVMLFFFWFLKFTLGNVSCNILSVRSFLT